jgi:hypothetical protein
MHFIDASAVGEAAIDDHGPDGIGGCGRGCIYLHTVYTYPENHNYARRWLRYRPPLEAMQYCKP